MAPGLLGGAGAAAWHAAITQGGGCKPDAAQVWLQGCTTQKARVQEGRALGAYSSSTARAFRLGPPAAPGPHRAPAHCPRVVECVQSLQEHQQARFAALATAGAGLTPLDTPPCPPRAATMPLHTAQAVVQVVGAPSCAWAPRRHAAAGAGRRRVGGRRRGAPLAPLAAAALWEQLGGLLRLPEPSGLKERALYRPQEMVQMGPFKVSPLGIGTWAWVSPSRPAAAAAAAAGWSWSVCARVHACPTRALTPTHAHTHTHTHALTHALQGNKLLWGYDESMDAELQEVFNLAVSSGVNLFDTADSYGARERLRVLAANRPALVCATHMPAH